MTTTTDLLRRAAERTRSHAAWVDDLNRRGEVLADADSLLALADQMERAEPVGYRLTDAELSRTDGRTPVVWIGVVEPGQHLYLHPAPEGQREPVRGLTATFLRELKSRLAPDDLAHADIDACIAYVSQEPKL